MQAPRIRVRMLNAPRPQPDADQQQRPALRVGEQDRHVAGVDHRQQRSRDDGQRPQDVAAHPRLGGERVAAHACGDPLADGLREIFQRLRQSAAGLALQRQRGGEEAVFGQLVALRHVAQCVLDRHADIGLLHQVGEFAAGRLRRPRATTRSASTTGRPTRTVRTIIASASGNCRIEPLHMALLAPAEKQRQSMIHATGSASQPTGPANP